MYNRHCSKRDEYKEGSIILSDGNNIVHRKIVEINKFFFIVNLSNRKWK